MKLTILNNVVSQYPDACFLASAGMIGIVNNMVVLTTTISQTGRNIETGELFEYDVPIYQRTGDADRSVIAFLYSDKRRKAGFRVEGR